MAITTLEEVKRTLGIKGNQRDEQIQSLIPKVEAWMAGYTNTTLPRKDGTYPQGYEKIAIEMIGYDLNNIAKQGFKSESLSRHSVTYASETGSYPVAITKGLRRKLRW